MSHHFGYQHALNLDEIHKVSILELVKRAERLGAEIKDIHPLTKIPGKGYTARGQATIEYHNSPMGSGMVYNVLFKPEDGTGSREHYTLGEIAPKFTPRRKVGAAELWMSLGTGFGNSWIPGINHLRLVGVNKELNGLIDIESLGMSEESWGKVVSSYQEGDNLSCVPRLEFDYTYHKMTKYGNPHAVVFTNPNAQNLKVDRSLPLFQVAAFLQFPAMSYGLEKIIEVIEGQ